MIIRRLRELVGSYWQRVRPPGINDMGHREAAPLSDGERLWNRMLDAGGCIECDKKPKGFFEGPSGGISTNVFCSQCGQGYNLTPMVYTAELIHRDERYVGKKEGELIGRSD